MLPPPAPLAASPSRLFADRRRGVDRRDLPRRELIHHPIPERRALVDRRRGAERRSTLDRRNRLRRDVTLESPGEHVRNALQLLMHVVTSTTLGSDERADLTAAAERLERAIRLLERRAAG